MKKNIILISLSFVVCITPVCASGLFGSGNNSQIKPLVKPEVQRQLQTQNRSKVEKIKERKNKKLDFSRPGSMNKEELKRYLRKKRAAEKLQTYEDLGLSSEQVKKAKELDIQKKHDLKIAFVKLRTEVKKLNKLKGEKASIFAIRKQKREVKKAKKELNRIFDNFQKAFKEILTDEQKIKYEELSVEKEKKFEKLKRERKKMKRKKNKSDILNKEKVETQK